MRRKCNAGDASVDLSEEEVSKYGILGPRTWPSLSQTVHVELYSPERKKIGYLVIIILSARRTALYVHPARLSSPNLCISSMDGFSFRVTNFFDGNIFRNLPWYSHIY
jgi:hypothetical protein